MGAVRSLSLTALLLGGCLSAPEGGKDTPDDAGPGGMEDCIPIDFTEDFDEPDWQAARWGASDSSEPGSLLAEGGRAVIAPSGAADDYGWFATADSFDVEERCVFVDVPIMFEYGEELDTEAFLGVYLGEHWISIGQSGGSLCCEHDLGEESVVERCETDYSPGAHARWRLRFDGDGVACDTAPVDGAWTEYRRFAYDGPYTGWLELLGGTWDDVDEPGRVAFDNVNQ
ncbi:MAG TPA: hypothetical protein VMZ28_11750 [Kofleriaceae bacterium]|nr:hypothetical protein [Kofleriaceae bacterium]